MALFFFLLTLITIIVVSLVLTLRVVGAVRNARFQGVHVNVQELPSLSICIPARNETLALADCLQSVLASNYPKLEILVLDDCSQDNTAQIIKSFAHDGVRFIEGSVPPDDWLGRPFASESLRREANSQWLLYLDVDTRVSSVSISRLMARALADNSTYLTVLPTRSGEYLGSTLFSPLRYFFALLSERPASGSAQLFKADELEAIGGFGPAKNQPEMETYFARQWPAERSRFWMSTPELGFTYDKKLASLREHALRTLYPSLARSPLMSLTFALVLLVSGLLPFGCVAAGLVPNHPLVLFFAAAIYLTAQVLPYYFFARAAYKRAAWLAALLMPLLLLQEAWLVLASMTAYQRGRVPWKDRNVCFPVLYH